MVNIGDKFIKNGMKGIIKMSDCNLGVFILLKSTGYCEFAAYTLEELQRQLYTGGWKLIEQKPMKIQALVTITPSFKGHVTEVKPKQIFTRRIDSVINGTQVSDLMVIESAYPNKSMPLVFFDLNHLCIMPESPSNEKDIIEYLNKHGYSLFGGKIEITQ